MSLSRSFSNKRRQSQMILAAVAVLIIISIIAVGVGLAMRPPQPPPLPENAAKTQAPKQDSNPSAVEVSGPSMPYSKPSAIRIPAIGLKSTPLLHYGQNPDGTVRVPLGAQTNEPAWYKLGPAPGQIGPAMIMGHVVDENNQPSIFYKLSALRKGDKVFIPRKDGQTAIFKITKVKTFPKNDFPTEMVYGPTDYSSLRLVTCGGLGGNVQLGEYSQNVIAFGKLTGKKPAS